jgi:hypothetical protein
MSLKRKQLATPRVEIEQEEDFEDDELNVENMSEDEDEQEEEDEEEGEEQEEDDDEEEAEEEDLGVLGSVKIVGAETQGKFLVFEGSSHFRQRLVCSTLSGKPIKIDNIRLDDSTSPGLKGKTFYRLYCWRYICDRTSNAVCWH